jgi:hypothetical protein
MNIENSKFRNKINFNQINVVPIFQFTVKKIPVLRSSNRVCVNFTRRNLCVYSKIQKCLNWVGFEPGSVEWQPLDNWTTD